MRAKCFIDITFIIGDGDSGEGTSGTSSGFVTVTPQPLPREQVLGAMQKAATSAKRNTPEPDTFAKKKRKQDDDFMKTMVEQSKTLTNVAQQFGAALQAPASASASSATPDDPLLGTIKLALATVPADKKMQCLMDILNLITNKYGPGTQ